MTIGRTILIYPSPHTPIQSIESLKMLTVDENFGVNESKIASRIEY